MNPLRPGPGAAAHARTAVVAAVLGALSAVAGCGTPAAPAPAPPAATAAPTSVAPDPGPATTGPSTPGPSAAPVPVTPVTSAAPGTGTDADRAAVETVFRTYLRAVAEGDFATACALNAPETNQRLLDELARRGAPAATCEEAIARLYAGSGVAQGAATIAETLEVRSVDVTGDAARVAWSVEVAGRRPVVDNELRRVEGQWRLLPTADPAG